MPITQWFRTAEESAVEVSYLSLAAPAVIPSAERELRFLAIPGALQESERLPVALNITNLQPIQSVHNEHFKVGNCYKK